MNIAVLVKYIPNPEGTPEMGPDNRLRREGVDGGLDPGDEHGVEAALQLAGGDGEVTVVTMGPEAAGAALRRALSMGAHKAVQITDDSLKGADTLVTARVLAAAIKKSEFDVVIAGVESTDGYTGTLPMTLAGLLGVPNVTFARKLEMADGKVRIERQTELGYDVVESELPVVVTVTAGATDPRYPTLKGIMQAKQKPVERYSVSDLGLSPDDVAPTQRITGVDAAPEKGPGEIVEDDGSGAQRIAQFLQEAKVI
jgi:electron transfer flavoprotein beta subunit